MTFPALASAGAAADLDVRLGVLGDSIDLSPVLGVRRLLVTGDAEALGRTKDCRPREVVGALVVSSVAEESSSGSGSRLELGTKVDGKETLLEERVEERVEPRVENWLDGRVEPRVEPLEKVSSAGSVLSAIDALQT